MPGATKTKTFSIPEADLNLIEEIQSRGRKHDISLNNGEVIRAGLAALIQLPDGQFAKIIKSLNRLKPGRRSKTG